MRQNNEDVDRPDNAPSNNNHTGDATLPTAAAAAAAGSAAAAAAGDSSSSNTSSPTAGSAAESRAVTGTASSPVTSAAASNNSASAGSATAAAVAVDGDGAGSTTRRSGGAGSSSSSGEEHSDAGLPLNWSLQLAPNGRIFFIDHNLRKTSWVDPRTGRASPMPNQARKPEDDLGALPEGWEERVHSDGRIFFIDHSEWWFFRCVLWSSNEN